MTTANSYAFFGASEASFFFASISISLRCARLSPSLPCNCLPASAIAFSATAHHSMISLAYFLLCRNKSSPSRREPNLTSRSPMSKDFRGRFAVGAMASAFSMLERASSRMASTSPERERERSMLSSASLSKFMPCCGSLWPSSLAVMIKLEA